MNSSLVNVIIPACGNGARFGMNTPKHLIDIAGKPMVAWVIEHLPVFCMVRVLVRAEYLEKTEEALSQYRNRNVQAIPVAHYQRGACETVISAAIHNPLKTMVINCDNVIVPQNGWFLFFNRYENAILTFIESSLSIEPPPFSYVKVKSGLVTKVAEKKRIGRYSCAGAFLFQDFQTLTRLCKWHLNNDPPDAKLEHYLAPVYNRLIEDSTSEIANVPLKSTSIFIRMGTPAEADDARKELNRVYGNQR